MSVLQRLYDIPAATVFGIFAAVAGWVVIGGLVWFFFFHHGSPAYNRNPSTAEMCMDWRIESPLEKHLDGPYIRDECQQYFQHRTSKDEAADDDYWQSKLTEAEKEWGNYKPRQNN